VSLQATINAKTSRAIRTSKIFLHLVHHFNMNVQVAYVGKRFGAVPTAIFFETFVDSFDVPVPVVASAEFLSAFFA